MNAPPDRRSVDAPATSPATASNRLRLVLKLGLIVALPAAYFLIPPLRAKVDSWLFMLAMVDVAALRDYVQSTGAWAPLASIGLMILQAVIAPLPAFVITFANAALFGWAWGALLSWTGAMLGAALCFALARWYGRGLVETLTPPGTLQRFDQLSERWGLWAVLVARLLPFIPFDPVSYAAGLARIGWWRFLLATGIGQLPATIVYSLAGDLLAVDIRLLALAIAAVFVVSTVFAWIGTRHRKRTAG